MQQTVSFSTFPALTQLSPDETLFRDSVYEFADKEIRPLVREMDDHAKIQPRLIDGLFGLGVNSSDVVVHRAELMTNSGLDLGIEPARLACCSILAG